MARKNRTAGADDGATAYGEELRSDTGTAAERDHVGSRYRVDDPGARDKFGGINWGSGFFGWLVAIAVAILLTSIIGAVAGAVSSSAHLTQSQAQRQAGTIGIAAAVVLLLVLAIAYYTGGYVAGRMSRFDGGKQGLAVWLIGLLVTVVALVLGAVFGSKYNILDRVSLPRIPVSTSDLSTGGVVAAVLVLVLTLVAAMAGGKVGHRYHDRVDRASGR